MEGAMKLSDTTTDYWLDVISSLESDFSDGLPVDFLRNPRMRAAIVASDPMPDWPEEMLAVVVKHFGETATQELLEEPEFGSPMVNNYQHQGVTYQGTHQTIQHLAHIARWREAAGYPEVSDVVEWGGGFGNTARLMKRLYNIDRYTIIDLPFVGSIQARYLEEVGVSGVEIASVEDADSVEDAELFISTWALSECKPAATQYVEGRRFFNADHLLLAAQPRSSTFESADDIKTALDRIGVSYHRELFRRGADDYYLFR